MERRDVAKALREGLSPWMEREGFSLEPGRDCFRRVQGPCIQRVVPSLVSWTSADFWDVHCHLELRFDAIESLLNAHKAHLSAIQAESTVTVRHFMDDLLPLGSDARPLSVVMARDVEGVLPDLQDRLGTYGLLYLHRWSTLAGLEAGYLQGREDWPELDPIRRAENLLAIAVLKKDRPAFDAMVREALPFMAKHRGGFYLRTFEDIAQGLSNDEAWNG